MASNRGRLLVFVAGAVAVLVAAVVVVIVSVDGDGPSPSTMTRSTASTPRLEPLQIRDEPLWTSNVDVGPVLGVETLDDVALYWGDDQARVVGLATGDEKWSIASGDDAPEIGDGVFWTLVNSRPRLVRHGDTVAVSATYACMERDCGRNADSHRLGLALLSVDTGDILWRTDTSSPTEFMDLAQQVWYADDSVVLISTTPLTPANLAPDQLHAMALDTRTGDVLWDREGFWPLSRIAGAVIGMVSDYPPVLGELTPPREGERVVAVELASGEQRWDVDARFGARPVATGGGVAVVQVDHTGLANGREAFVLDASGRELAKIDGGVWSCAVDDEMVACTGYRGSEFDFVTVRIEGREISEIDVDLNSSSEITVDSVWKQRIFMNDPEKGKNYTIDTAGNRIDQLPGTLAAMADDYAIFLIEPATAAAYYPIQR